jgi:carbon monoxide dehydrogenase subunit G
VKLSGVYAVPAAQERVYELLQDPGVLARCMPGCESLERIGDNEYAMRLKMVLASIKGLFDGKITVADLNPPSSFRLVVDGSGKIGFVRGDGVLNFATAENGTSVNFEGEVNVGGTIASVGQRLIDTTARMLIKRFFGRMAEEAKASGELRRAAD